MEKKRQDKENKIRMILNGEVENERARYTLILTSSVIWGILAHGLLIFNLIAYHDDVQVFFGPKDITGGIEQGRWMCGLYGYILQKLYTYDYAVPLFKATGSFVLIGASWILLSRLMEINHKKALVLVSGILVLITSITSIFGYIYMALYYTAALFFSVAGGCILCRAGKWYEYAAGILLCEFAIGTYQLFFVTGVLVFVIYMYKEVLEKEYGIKCFFLEGIKYIGISAVVLVLYVITTRVLVAVTGIPLSDYKNISSMGIVSPAEYADRIKMSYGAFFCPNRYVSDVAYPNATPVFYSIMLMIYAAVLIAEICRSIYEGKKHTAVELAVLALLTPPALNLIFVLAGAAGAIQYYAHVFFYIIFIYLVFRRRGKWNHVLAGTALGCLLVMNIFLCRYSNACYVKATLLQQHAISYFESLQARIEAAEGYQNGVQVVMIEPGKKIVTNPVDYRFESIKLEPYSVDSLINGYTWYNFMRFWTGFSPHVVYDEAYAEMDEVREMPVYPDDGSIRMIDGVIVVKFGEVQNPQGQQ